MVAEGLSGSRVRNVLNAARAVFRDAVTLDEIEDTPIKNLILPSNRAGASGRHVGAARERSR